MPQLQPKARMKKRGALSTSPRSAKEDWNQLKKAMYVPIHSLPIQMAELPFIVHFLPPLISLLSLEHVSFFRVRTQRA